MLTLKKINHHALLLLLLIVLEIGLLTFLRNKLGIYLSPIVLFFTSISIPIYIHYLYSRELISFHSLKKGNFSFRKLLPWIIFIFGTILFLWKFTNILKDYPIDPSSSDILPAIDIYTSRFLSGETVYTTFPAINGYKIEPNYLPMQWLPFTISQLSNFDHRFIAAFIFIIALFMCYYVIISRQEFNYLLIIKALLPFFILYEFMHYEPNMLGHTIEIMIAGYYLILFTTMLGNSSLLIALGILICLLSRYSLVFWLPLYFAILFFKQSQKIALYTALYVFIGICIIYIIPFLSQDWMSFKRGYEYYLNGTLGEWYPHAWQKAEDKPFHLCRGIGAACFFYDFAPGDNIQKMALSRTFNVVISVSSIILLSVFFLKYKRIKDYTLYSLLSLKFYFAVFYTFIHVPYVYLHLVPVILSAFLFISLRFNNSYLKTNNSHESY